MGASILGGLLAKGIVLPGQVLIHDQVSEKAEAVSKEWKVESVRNSLELLKRSNIVLLAFKPQDLKQAVQEFSGAVQEGHLFISILAGTSTRKLREAIGQKVKIVRAMPNLGVKVREGMTALNGDDESSLGIAEEIFSGCGKTVRVEEKHFDLVTALSGSGPAYFFLLMELMIEEGVKEGLKRDQAGELAIQTALGASLLAQSSGCSPDKLRQMVTSKGGTTEAALKVFENHQFAKIIKEAIQAAQKRGRELNQD